MEKELLTKFWEELSSRINLSVGKLIVPAFKDAHINQVKEDLIETGLWVDEQLEKITQ